MDYTLAHYGMLTRVSQLDATLCFVDGKGGVGGVDGLVLGGGRCIRSRSLTVVIFLVLSCAYFLSCASCPFLSFLVLSSASSASSASLLLCCFFFVAKDRQDDMSDQVWDSGDVGGFQCYIVADEEGGTEAAEVYQAKSTEEEDQLLSIPPANNTLSLVMRDGGIMQFVKYVSAFAPGSRWDLAAVYDLEDSGDSEGSEAGGEGEEGSSSSSSGSSASESD